MAERFILDLDALDALAPEQRRLALQHLKTQHQAHKANPLWRFDPLDAGGTGVAHTKQHEWMSAMEFEGEPVKRRLFVGGNRSGKTTGGIVADIIDCCDEVAIPPHLRRYKRWHEPMKMFLVVVDARTAETVQIPKLREWVPQSQLVGGGFARAFSKELSRLHFKNGSWLQIMTQRMEVEAFAGADLHRVHFDEEPIHEHGRAIYSECMARLVDHNGDLLLTMTPQQGMTWVYDELFLPWVNVVGESAQTGFAVIQEAPMFAAIVDMDDNPTLDARGKRSALASYKTAEEVQSRKAGRFVSFSGRIYDQFETAKHVVPDSLALEHLHSPTRQMLATGIDPGFRERAGVVWVTLDEDGVWVIAELGLGETVIGEVCKQIHLKNNELGVTAPDLYPSDPAILKRDSQTGKSDQLAFLEAGIPAVPGTNDVRPGINKIRGLLAENKFHIAASCTTLREEFIRYRWVNPKRSEHAPRAVPVKRDDHLLDAMRYAIMALPLPEPAPPPDNRPQHEKVMAKELERMRRPKAIASPYGGGYFA